MSNTRTPDLGRIAGGYHVYREDIPAERAEWERRADPFTILAGDERSEYVLTLTDAQARRVWERDDAGQPWRLPTPTAKVAPMRGLRVAAKFTNVAGYTYTSGHALGDWAAYSHGASQVSLLHVPTGQHAPTPHGTKIAAAKKMVERLHALPVTLLEGLTWGDAPGSGDIRQHRADLFVLRAIVQSAPVTPDMLAAVLADREALDAPTPEAAAIAPVEPTPEPVTPEPEHVEPEPVAAQPEPTPEPVAKPTRKRPAKRQPARQSAPIAPTLEAVERAVMATGTVTAKMAQRTAQAFTDGIPGTEWREGVPAGDAHAAMLYGCGPSSVGRRRGDTVLAALHSLTGSPVSV